MPPAYCGRFAPSPTGPLHFGSLVAALASCCDARHRGGAWLLRIEDVDEPRSRAGAEDAIVRTLLRHGFAWDGDVERQSARTARYDAALGQLRSLGIAYPCACTRQELASAPVGAGGVVEFVDMLQGRQRQDLPRDVGDFVVRRADELFAYQLAVVVDDAAQGVTHVVRGADLMASTPRQIALQRMLGLPQPEYLHVPVAIDEHGDKLSKQTGAPALRDDDPLPALVAAWRFLDQPCLPAVNTVEDFWRRAIPAWSRGRLPPTRMLPAGSMGGGDPGRPV